MRQDILFYSKFCEYSSDIVSLLNKKGARGDFTLVCVDTIRNKLPVFVDRVPLIYTQNNMILYDDAIVTFIEKKYPTVPEEISPFSLQQETVFSFLGDGGGEEMHKEFTMLGQEQKIITSVFDEDEENKKAKIDSSLLDKYMQDRDADVQVFKKVMNHENGACFNRI